ncbi:MAG: extracellular solute-binding protein [Clostridia bacterium]|nr:extracellular solute-binding protein [Clostridia bacterium]
MTKRIISLLLSVAILATVFAGCKKDNNVVTSTVYEYEYEYEYVNSDGIPVGKPTDDTTNNQNEGDKSDNNSAESDKSNDADKSSDDKTNNKDKSDSDKDNNKNSGADNKKDNNKNSDTDNKNSNSDNKNDGNKKPGSDKNTQNSNSSDNVTNSGSNNNSDTSGTPNNLDTGNTNKTGFPIVKKQESISVMTYFTAGLGDIANSQFTEEYEKLTNMKIDWRLYTENVIKQQVILALQSGNLPDIIAGTTLDDESMLQYSANGTFVEITKDLLKEWAPNVYETYNKNPEAWNITKTSNGKMYAFAGLSKDWNYAQHYLWVRTTWLKKLGLSKPKTMDDFYKMLIAFRDGDPNGNGQQDEVPFAALSDSGFIFNPWGFTSPIAVSNSGKVTNMYTTSNMKEAVTYWAKIYKEGLVDKNSMNNSSGSYAAFHTLTKSGKVGCFFVGYPQLEDKLLKEYEILPYPTSGNNGDFPSVAINVNPVVNRGQIIITKKCKNVSAALRWIDYLYTDDGYMLRRYGSEGDYYKKTSDTTYEFTGNPEPKNPGPSYALRGKDFLANSKITNEKTTLIDEQRAVMDKWCGKTLGSNGQKLLPTTWKNKDEINAEKIYTSYWDSVKYNYDSFIQGKKNIGSDWTSLINEMNSKGMNKYIAILQKYYDRCN